MTYAKDLIYLWIGYVEEKNKKILRKPQKKP